VNRYAALILPAALLIDNLVTFTFSGSLEMISRYEYSPVIRYAAAHDLIIPLVIACATFYAVASYLILESIADPRIHSTTLMIIGAFAFLHIYGGLGWVLNVLLAAPVYYTIPREVFLQAYTWIFFGLMACVLPLGLWSALHNYQHRHANAGPTGGMPAYQREPSMTAIDIAAKEPEHSEA
jgi:hypothetical protein